MREINQKQIKSVTQKGLTYGLQKQTYSQLRTLGRHNKLKEYCGE